METKSVKPSNNIKSRKRTNNNTSGRNAVVKAMDGVQNSGDQNLISALARSASDDRLHHSSSGSDGCSHDSSSNAYAEPPSLNSIAGDMEDIADVMSELSETEDMQYKLNSMAQEWSQENSLELEKLIKLAAQKDGFVSGPVSPAELADPLSQKHIDPETEHRLQLLLEAAGVSKLTSTDGKAFADPEVLRKLTSSVSVALDEAAAALTRMRAEQQNLDHEPVRSLADACADGDLEAVKRLLSDGRSVHETTEDGDSLLCIACSKGYYELAELLLLMKANVEDRGCKNDLTPLMEAASGGYVDIVKLLINYDADVNAFSTAGHTALHHAAVGGFEEVVHLLIVSGANVEEQNENGHTPLMEAASAGHVGVAKILLDAGAGINTHSNEFKESALTLACYKGHLEMVKFLLDAGADQEHKTDEMHTALMEASMDGHVEVARLLLDSGAQVNMPADSFESPLTLAACGGHVELANLLIDRGANLEEVNDEGYTPLMEAAREGHEEMVALLLAHDAEVNAQTEEMQETALTLSCCGGFLEVAHFLIRASADIELGCSTPLMEAAQEGHIELTKYLIRQGANVHANTQTGDTALTYACENGHTDVADVLLQAGAELEHESEGGRTPLMKAARAGHVCTVNFLISKGANVNAATTNHDHTVLSLACAGGHLQVVETLLKHNADPMIKLKDGSTMVIEAAKGGHTNVVNALLDFPQTVYKTIASSVSSEYPDSIPMADDMPPDPTVPKELKNTETLAARLEGFIHKMMCQAENLSGTREEQMAKKQEILEELQRVEQELKIRTLQAQENQSIVNIDNIADGMQDLSQTSFDSIPPPPASPMLEGSECYEGQEELMMGLTEQHEYVEQSLQKTLKEQQSHQLHLQQQKQFYQERLQTLKQQYQQKQHQLQQHRQQLLSQAANSSTTCVNPPSNGTPGQEADGESCERNRQPIPLHIALQNHLQAHHVTEGNVSDLAQALQDWDTRDRNNIIINHSQLKPMPTFNLAPLPAPDGTAAPTNEIPPSAESPTEEPLPLELPEPMVEAPPSRSLADALSTLIQAADSPHNNTQFDKELERVIGDTHGNDLEKMETLEWLKSMEPELGPLVEQQQYQMLKKNNNQTVPGKAVPVPKQATTRKLYNNNDKLNSNAVGAGQIKHITKVPNTAINNHQCSGGKGDGMSQSLFTQPPQPPRSSSPARVPGGSGVDPNAETDSNHDTALTLACAGGHAELVRLLLSRNAVIEHRDKKGFTPLILAATAGHAEVVEILAEHNADIEAQSERTKDTPLSLACSGGRYEVVEILLKLGANKEHRNVSDYTPLSLAASGGYVNIIKLLLSYGAEINSRTGSKLGISPLMLAAMNGHSSAVKLLLDMGSDINAQIETNKNTALTLACFQGRHEVVNFLVDRKANIEHRAKTGLTPLMEAASGGYVEVGRVLLDKHADVNAPPVPSSRDTALTIAADKGHYRFVELLLARGAIVDVKNKKGNSPLWLACNGGHLDVVQKLVSCGADIDSQDNRRVSCLMTSFRKGHIKVVKWLVRNVTQFPGDKELVRYIKTLEEKTEKSDKEVLRKCKSCMEIITHAKECQLREANKNATILLEQIESEKSREEKRKQAAARKRDKKKQQRKKKQQENNPDEQCSETPERSPTPEEPEISEQTIENEERTITNEETTTSANPITDIKGARVNRNQNNIVQPDEVENKENRGNARNRRNKKNSKTSKTVHEINQTNREKTSEQHAHNSRISDLDDFNEPPIQNSISRGPTRNKRSNMTNGGDYSEPKTRSKTVNPSPGKKKREDGWKEVPTRKQKRVHIPAAQVSLVYEELENIRKESGAHIEIENSDISPRKSNGDRFIIVRGSADSTKTACSRVSDILKNNELVHIVGSSKQKSAVWNRSEHAPSLNGAADSQSSLKFADFFAGLPSEQKPKPASAKTTVTAGSASRNQPAWGRSNSKPAPAQQTAAIVKPTVRVPTPAAVPVVIPPSPKANAVRKLFAPPAVSQPPVSAVEPMHAPSPVQAVQKSPPQPIGPPPVIVHTSVHNAVNTGVHGAIERPVSSTVNRAVTRPISRTSTAPIKPDFHPVNSFEPFRQQPISLPNMIPTGYDPELPTGYPEMSTGYPEEKFSKAPGHKPNLSPGSQLGMSSGPSRFTPTSDHNASFSRNVTHASQSPFEETPRSLMSGPFGETQYLSNSLPASGFTDRPGFASGDMTLDQEKRYTSTKNPLTLPRHMPMLNPNASEFTASQFGSRGDVMSQGSPRAQKGQMSPGFVSAPSPQNVEQELYGGKSIMYPHQSGTPPAKMNPAFQTNRGNMYSPAKSGLSPPAGNVSPKNVDMMRQQSMFTEKRQPQYGPLFTGPPIQQPQYNSNQNVWGSSWQAGFNHPIMNDQFSGMNGRFDSASLFATDTSYGGQFGLTDPPPVLAPFPNAPYSGMQYNTMGAGDASNMLQGAAWGAPVTNNVNNSPFSQDWNGGFDNQPQ